MSCNGCRVLRKRCSESCVLRHCLQWIESHESQAHATAFLAKYFGRSKLISLISTAHEIHRPALFQSLLYEACGRTLNPVDGVIGLIWTGNWHACHMAVETVLGGGIIQPMSIPAVNLEAKMNINLGSSSLSSEISVKEDTTKTPTPLIDSEDSATMSFESYEAGHYVGEPKLLNLFV
ncbi:Lob domain-containing protein [Thalictrum thalictroides]|uniref:Lob domain-containing protein n=1 Tax=Thalictrum thalictroides TaxID=46969 RepID=A0A7J6UWV1_THATH|nr:Lob domain-containing protein [Thalictrum thalictroides]